ncbi:MAG: S-layer homology domain-containing protein, partial [Lachnospiraceae bacterium]|nr:S-layer homology domain-containing protein [Lachnospiraceae bacterium]
VFADNTPGNIFVDIKADSWMYAPANSVYDKGYMTGTGTLDGRVLFSPNTDMNRTMFVQALYSMDGKPDVTYVQKFSDVKESAWYAKAVTWASNNGVVAGNPDGTFGINGKATREQLALMFYKYAVSKGFDVSIKPSTTLDGFSDSKKVDSWALTAVKWAVERGIISGKGNASAGYRIAPTEKATRVECAAMMNKFSEIYANAPKMGDDDLEEPLALPEEEIEDLPVPSDETEDVIIDEDEEIKDDEIKDDEIKDDDVPSKDETDADDVDENSEVENSADTEE